MDYFYNTFEPIYLELKKSVKIVIFFAYFEDLQNMKNYLESFIPKQYLISSLISPFVYFDMFITAEINGPNFPLSLFNTHKIQLYHGIGVVPLYKKADVLSRFNTHFALGKQLVEFLETLPHKKENQNRYVEIGFPKLDTIVNPDPEQVKFIKNLYNITDQFVILYAPHWNPNGSLNNLSLEFLEDITKLENVLLIIKVHNFLYVKYKKENWQKKLSEFSDKHQNVVYVTRPNTQELFPLADMLITDAITTTVFEFALTFKPTFAYSCSQWFETNSNYKVEAEMRDMSILFDTASEIYQYTKKLLERKESILKRIELQRIDQNRLVNKYLFNVGKATDAAVKEINSILKIDTSDNIQTRYTILKNRLIRLLKNNPLCILSIIFWNCKLIYHKTKGKKTIVYNIQYDYFYAIFEPLYRKLRHRPDIDVYFAYNDKNLVLRNYLTKFIPFNKLISSQISPFVYFDLFITAEINGPDFPASIFATRKIQMYHGTGVYPLYKKIDVLKRFNIHFAVGPQFVKFIEILPHYKNNINKYEIIGYPKLDLILHPDQTEINQLKDQYEIRDQFIILYTPHWNPYGSLQKFGLDMIHEISQIPDVVILIKVHHFLFIRYKENNWQQKINSFCSNHPNVKMVSDPNTQKIFPLGDIMITDTGTTAAFEFSLMDKPVFIYCNNDWFDDEKNVDVEVERELIDMAVCFDEIKQICEFIKQLKNNDTAFMKEIQEQKLKQKQLINKYLFNPGSATEAALEIIERELNIND